MRGGSGVPCRWLAGRGVVWWAGCRCCHRIVLHGGALRAVATPPQQQARPASPSRRPLPPAPRPAMRAGTAAMPTCIGASMAGTTSPSASMAPRSTQTAGRQLLVPLVAALTLDAACTVPRRSAPAQLIQWLPTAPAGAILGALSRSWTPKASSPASATSGTGRPPAAARPCPLPAAVPPPGSTMRSASVPRATTAARLRHPRGGRLGRWPGAVALDDYLLLGAGSIARYN